MQHVYLVGDWPSFYHTIVQCILPIQSPHFFNALLVSQISPFKIPTLLQLCDHRQVIQDIDRKHVIIANILAEAFKGLPAQSLGIFQLP